MTVTTYTANGNNSAIKVRKLPRKVLLNNLYFRFDKSEKAYIYEQDLKSAPGYMFCFCIYHDNEWFIRVYDQYGNTSHYQDVLRDLVDSSPTEYKQALRIRCEVEAIMSWLTVQRVITGHVPGAII